MSLEMLFTHVRTSYVGPDKIVALIEYQLPLGISYHAVQEFLVENEYQPDRRNRFFINVIEGERYTFPFDVKVTYAPRRGRLYVYVTINAQRYLHREYVREHGPVEGEICLDDTDNWLPDEIVEIDNRHVWRVADNLIWDAERSVTQIVEALVRSQDRVTLGLYQGVSISRLEVTGDFRSENPIRDIERVRPHFEARIHDLHYNRYRPRTSSCESLEGNVFMLHGYTLSHNRYKLYNKCNCRVRVEYEVSTDGFSTIGVSRSLCDHGNNFARLFEAVADQCVPIFNELISGSEVETETSRTPMEFLLAIGRTCRDETRAQTIAQLLVQTGRVTSDFGYSYLRPLLERRIIQRRCRGVYVPAPEWRNAVRELRASLGNLLREVA